MCFNMAKDCQGILRGACTVCDCRMFVSDKGIRCDYCNDAAAKHQNISFSPPNPKPPVASQPYDADEAVATDDSEDDLPVMFDQSLQNAFPSTPNFFGR